MTQSLNLAVIPGDGIGPEVIAVAMALGLKLVSKGVLGVQVTTYPLGASHFLETGETLSEETLDLSAAHNATRRTIKGGVDSQCRGNLTIVKPLEVERVIGN